MTILPENIDINSYAKGHADAIASFSKSIEDRLDEIECNALYDPCYEPKHRIQDKTQKKGYVMTLTEVIR